AFGVWCLYATDRLGVLSRYISTVFSVSMKGLIHYFRTLQAVATAALNAILSGMTEIEKKKPGKVVAIFPVEQWLIDRYIERQQGLRPPPRDPAAEEFAKKWQDRLHEIRISHIENEHIRAIAEINNRYQHERDEARAAGRDISLVERARLAEIEGERRRFAKETHEAREPLLYELSRTRIEATLKGAEKQKALLKLEKERALFLAGDDPVQRRRTEELFKLRAEIQAGRQAAMDASRSRFAGTSVFGSASWYKDIAGRGGVDPALQGDRNRERHLKNIDRNIRNKPPEVVRDPRG
ncbi:hypothetical protein LCGC14_1805690, partial [marine sediment metagenome]